MRAMQKKGQTEAANVRSLIRHQGGRVRCARSSVQMDIRFHFGAVSLLDEHVQLVGCDGRGGICLGLRD